MANILLTGGRAPAALELARIFHKQGHVVFMAESARGHLSEPSRALKVNYWVPPPRQQTGAFLEALRQIVIRDEIDLLIPTCEEVFYVGMGRSCLPCKVFAESIEKLQGLHNKWSFALHASDLGLAVPESFLIRTTQELMLAFAQWQKLIIKPVYSRFATRTLIEPTIKQALNLVTFDSAAQWVAQELIPGTEICTYSVVQRGRLTAHSAYRSDFTAGRGAAVVFQPLTHQGTFDWVQRFVAAIGFTGQIAFDFIETPDGEVNALECNPRATSGVHLFASQPEFANAFLDDSSPCVTPALKKASAMLSTGMLVYGLGASLKKRRLWKWLQTILSSRDVIFDVLDPLPYLLQWRGILAYLKLGRMHRLSLLAASTFDIEWNGEDIDLDNSNKEKTTS
jgi:predicted ATP-grasp superfamily ATP-dependent carboligase